jgi:hypothetical protein
MNDRPFLARVSSRRPPRGSWFLAAFAFVTQACAPSLGGAVRSYEHARYPEAMDELRAVEVDANHRGASSATRYALYRGLAHLGLGDLRAARFWLERVRQTTLSDPRALSADETGQLASAWAHLPR